MSKNVKIEFNGNLEDELLNSTVPFNLPCTQCGNPVKVCAKDFSDETTKVCDKCGLVIKMQKPE